MKTPLILLLLACPVTATAQAIPAGNWDVKSTAVDLVVPGTPGFMLRMMRGKSKTDHKCIAPEQAKAGIAALMTPDPKSHCSIESMKASGGRFEQVLQCPQKTGQPMRATRSGTYDGSGFSGRLTMAGQTPKGAMRVVLDQVATHTASSCQR